MRHTSEEKNANTRKLDLPTQTLVPATMASDIYIYKQTVFVHIFSLLV